jgi:6-phosphogluconolactonase
MAKIVILADPHKVAEHAAGTLRADLDSAIAEYGDATWVAVGGSTPTLAYDVMANGLSAGLPWDKVSVLMGDERCVDPAAADSNWRQLSEHLLEKVSVDQERLLRPKGELGPYAAAEDYAKVVAALPRGRNGGPRLDHVWLGMGEDGHTLSLFPGHPDSEPGVLVTPITDSPKPPPERVTLTLDALRDVGTCLFIVTGSGKRAMLDRALAGDMHVPAARAAAVVEENGGTVSWLLDAAAHPDG